MKTHLRASSDIIIYPLLMQHIEKVGMVVLFSDIRTGCVLSLGDTDYVVGHYSSAWAKRNRRRVAAVSRPADIGE